LFISARDNAQGHQAPKHIAGHGGTRSACRLWPLQEVLRQQESKCMPTVHPILQ
jgi:hypothetical protein